MIEAVDRPPDGNVRFEAIVLFGRRADYERYLAPLRIVMSSMATKIRSGRPGRCNLRALISIIRRAIMHGKRFAMPPFITKGRVSSAMELFSIDSRGRRAREIQ